MILMLILLECLQVLQNGGDYDNDNDLDILITGYYNYSNKTTILYRNESGVFVNANAGIIGITHGNITWGDYDSDGDLDILLTGSSDSNNNNTKIYKNTSGIFTEVYTNLPQIQGGFAKWGDYDNDGDLDILISGSQQNIGRISKIFNNNNGIFSDINAGLVRLADSAGDWGDYDNDGDLDVLLTGHFYDGSWYPILTIYRNDNGVFNDIGVILAGVRYGSAEWGDFDNDGDLDFILSGTTLNGEISKIYSNENGLFTDINAGITALQSSSSDWGDYDNDGDLDFIISGSEYISSGQTLIYTNNINSQNSIPNSPTNLNWNFNNLNITLNWDASNDLETPQAGLSYNLKIATNAGGSEIKSAMSNSNGYRQIVEMGNVNHVTSWSLTHASSNIFWSVQAVDHSFAGSPFSIEDTIILAGLTQSITDVPNDQGGRVSIRWQASELDNDVNTLQHYSIWRAIPVTENITKIQETEKLQKSSTQKEKNKYIEFNGESYYWEWITDQPAHRLPYYSYTCETLYDSMSTTNGMHYFMISAHTNDPNVFFDSNPDSGYSVDNIAPLAPDNLAGMYASNQINLHWNPNKESDLREYVLYRSTTPNINPATDTVFATTTDTTFTDTNPIPASDIYYIVCARDIHDNLSNASNEVEILITGILKDGLEIPKTYALYQNYPNPFNPYTVIKFDLPKNTNVKVVVFNSLGKTVATIINEPLSPGKYQYIWKPENLSSGLYFYTIQAENFRSVKKMLLVK